MDDVFELISQDIQKDDHGVQRKLPPVYREVFCRVDSVTRAEFFAGGRNGLNPEYRFTINALEYHGETACRYHGQVYGIYRTYRTAGDYMELYAERKGGLNV